MAARYQKEILAQIREGKRFWSYAETGRNFDAFKREVVEPLRELKYAGVITALSEVESTIGGREQITGVQIIGAVDVRAEDED